MAWYKCHEQVERKYWDRFGDSKHYPLRRAFLPSQEVLQIPPRKINDTSANLLAVLHYLKAEDVFKEYDIRFSWSNQGVGKMVPTRLIWGFAVCQNIQTWWLWHWWVRFVATMPRVQGWKLPPKDEQSYMPFGGWYETGHYLQLQVILAYFYLMSVGIKCCGKMDYGHFMLHLEDWTQTRIQEIWGMALFINHINVSE